MFETYDTTTIDNLRRRGELLALRWADVDATTGIAFLGKTKNGQCRRIPLTPRALEILGAFPRDTPLVFPATPAAVRQAWDRIRLRAGIGDLHFHDLRHEAISRLFEAGLIDSVVIKLSQHGALPPALLPDSLYGWAQCEKRPSL